MTLTSEQLAASLSGKKAIVTGASRGIGKAIAVDFARAGADVAVLARDEGRLAEVASVIQSHGQVGVVAVADVLEPETFRGALAAAVEGLGGVDILVNNAGGNRFTVPLTQARFSGWSKNIQLNLESVVHACQEILPVMYDQKSGSVINISSVTALRGAPGMSHYAAAKAGIVSLTQSVALESARQGVRVNALLPGWVYTEFTEFFRATEGTEEAVLSRVPMNRWGEPEEIAAVAQFLGSDASSFMTGQAIAVDGGLSAMP